MKNNIYNRKIEFLDSLRGLAAFNVIICHFVVVYFPQMYYKEYADSWGGGYLVYLQKHRCQYW